MKAIYIIIFLLIQLSSAAAETGIVLNATNHVQYKYDTDTRPSLQPGEYIVAFEDINSVLAGAKYDGVTFVNPEPPVQYEEKLVETSGIDPVTQAAISAVTGAGAAWLVVRRKKV